MAAGVSAAGRSNPAGEVRRENPDESQSPSPPGWGLRPTISSRKRLTERRNSTSRCSAVVEQVTARMTSDCTSLWEAVIAVPSAVDAKTTIMNNYI